jgi:hypothetical protein
MKDWERKLVEKVAEDMREAKQICLRNYSEAMLWYSGERLLEVAPDIKIYTLVSGCTTLLGVNDILYMRTLEGFDPLGKLSELIRQVNQQEPQTDSEQRTAEAQKVLDSLDWLRSSALARLNGEIPGLDIQKAHISRVGYEPSNESCPVENGEIVLWTTVDVSIHGVLLDQLADLLDISSEVVVSGVNMADTPVTYDVEYKMSYDFALWDDEFEDNFAK